MAELAKAIETESEVVITESVAYAELLLCSNTDFQLVFCSCVGNNLPVVLSIHERSVRNHGTEEVICL